MEIGDCEEISGSIKGEKILDQRSLFISQEKLNSMEFYLWLYSPLLNLSGFFSFLILHTVGRTPWTGDQPVTRPLPTHRINIHRHPSLEYYSNPRSQCSCGRRRFMP
jgi:hypothetical protein